MPPEPEGTLLSQFLFLSADGAAETAEMNPVFSILLLFVLILINGFFAASEIAVITLNDNKIRKMAEDGNKKAKKLLRLTSNSSRFLSTIQIGVTLSGFLTSASASQSFAYMLADHLTFLPFDRSAIVGVATVLITLLLSYFSLVLGELVPKKIAMQRAEQLSFKFVGILSGTEKIFRPFIALLTFSTNIVLRVFGFNPNESDETVTEEEILMMVDAGTEKNQFDASAKDMIANIFEFDDTTAGEIMTHRTEVCAVEDTTSIGEVVQLAQEKGYSRIPVYHEDIDSIVGVVYAKDLLRFVGKPVAEEIRVTDVMRSAYYVPETKRCYDLFKEMTERKVQFAVIIDEYGGTEGIITMEDLLESIVGNIQDEYDNEEEEIHKVSDNAYTVDGSTLLDDIEDLTGTELPEGDYDTIAGLVVELLGHIPKENEHPTVTLQNLTFTVEAVEDQRISKILIVKNVAETLPEPEDE